MVTPVTLTPSSIYPVYRQILDNDHSVRITKIFSSPGLTLSQISMPIAAILALTELIAHSNAGTMFELVGALNDATEVLKSRAPNPISLSAGCELFVAFVTTFPHESDVSLSVTKRLTLFAHCFAEL